ncbi:MAG: glycosyltransferase family 39 protein, partial [candidate division Zixibacteria bacterium]|nr:glycosyltransferase family 39 protein [candidate division Zixibacteria bacterium]
GVNLDEAFYASVSRNISQSGDWLAFTYTDYYFSKFAEHPPLVFWIQAICYKLFGANDQTARIFGALCSIGSIQLLYLIGKDSLGRSHGFVAALILILCINFVSIGNSALLDVPMTFFLLLALWPFAKSNRTGSRLLWSGVGLGLGFLVKGFSAAPMFLAVFLIVVIWRRELLKTLTPYLAALIAVAIPGAYVLVESLAGPDFFWGHYFGTQLGEIVREGAGSQQGELWNDFAWRLLRYFLPWTILLIPGIFLAVRNRISALYPTLMALACFTLVYSYPHYVFIHYFAPVYPLAALIVAYPIMLFLDKKSVSLGRFPGYFLVVWVVLFAIVSLSGVRIHHLRNPDINDLRPTALNIIERSGNDHGLFLNASKIDWEIIALTSWYWDAEILYVTDTDQSPQELIAEHNPGFILTPASNGFSSDELSGTGFEELVTTDRLILYARLDISGR